MNETYHAHGIRFEYPADWELAEQHSGPETIITVSSPQTSFWSVSLFRQRPSPEHVAETVVRAFRDEYEQLDVYTTDEDLDDLHIVGRHIEFFCLELLNSAWIRAFSAPKFTGLVLYQGTDDDLEEALPLLEGITDSLAWEDEFPEDAELWPVS